MDNKKLIEYWISSSDDDYNAMQVLYKNKQYTWAIWLLKNY